MFGNKIPVFHKIIQPIIHQDIQPVITTEIQPIINIKIQPIYFKENQTNIEEEIQRLNQSAKKNVTENVNKSNYKEKEPKEPKPIKNKVELKPKLPEYPKPNLNQHPPKIGNFEIQPYIIYQEQHTTMTETLPPQKMCETKIVEKFEYHPYILRKDGKTYPYVKQNANDRVKDNTQVMETIVAVNFVSVNQNINFPMAFKNKDIFSKAEKKLYNKYPELKSKKVYFIANGNIINTSLSFEQNKIKSGNTILIKEYK